MATSLEAIAQKLQEERQNKLESILSISGSQSIAKNNYGITVVEESNVASSLLFKELNYYFIIQYLPDRCPTRFQRSVRHSTFWSLQKNLRAGP
jgi:hypothetical protein